MVYALLLDRLEQQVTAERQVAAVFIAAGAKDVVLPTLEQARQDFDKALTAAPKAVDRDREELLRALGIR